MLIRTVCSVSHVASVRVGGDGSVSGDDSVGGVVVPAGV